MTTEAKVLSECGTEYIIDAAEPYKVAIDAGEYLVVEVGATAGKASASFTHPNISETAKRIYHFRTYYASGHKRWRSRAGVSHYFVIPRSAVTLLPEKGCSYVKALINGVKVSFNVSGGGGPGWTDYLHTHTQISINHKVSDLKRIAAVAVRGTKYEGFVQIADPITADEEKTWNRLAAKANGKLKAKICKLVEEGKRPMVQLLDGYSYGGNGSGVASRVERRYKKVPITETSWQYEETGAVKSLVMDVGYGDGVRAKVSQIDWFATAKANGIAA